MSLDALLEESRISEPYYEDYDSIERSAMFKDVIKKLDGFSEEEKSLIIMRYVDELDLKVRPEHIGTASPKALEVNGYNEADWRDAVDLRSAMERFAALTKDAMLTSHNITFEHKFTEAAFRKLGIADPMDYHRPDLFTASLESLRLSGLAGFNLVKVAAFLGIEPEPDPHRAINGARQALDVYRKIRELNRRLWNPEVLAALLAK